MLNETVFLASSLSDLLNRTATDRAESRALVLLPPLAEDASLVEVRWS